MLNPALGPPELMREFFAMYWQWNWPTPVSLVPYDDKPPHLNVGGTFSPCVGHPPPLVSSWNPEKNATERHHVMPVITPTYPHLNSTFNVSHSTLNLIQAKMRRAKETCDKVFNGEDNWDSLFQVSFRNAQSCDARATAFLSDKSHL